MHKTELVDAVASAANLSKEEAHEAVTTILDEITNALSRNEPVNLVGFGSFSCRARAERSGRNPVTGAVITIAASTGVGFKPGKALKDALNN
ncbi:HU family DNA-binding protein [Halioxenophilus sp. WMMB6]|uniref:HU family DNA-binding protein n=1 Tax=Halioxenophilus sp. WMMB6 TaxID=3073815 RepID=UPI00295E24CE|nr:HU family DNA-binding protein [Halioxenophilus sp. WMMB6]